MSKKPRRSTLFSCFFAALLGPFAPSAASAHDTWSGEAGSLDGSRMALRPVPRALLYPNLYDRKEGIGDIDLFKVPLLGAIDGFGLRYASSVSGFSGLELQAFFVGFKLPFSRILGERFVVQPRLTVEGGRLMRGGESRAIAAFGPGLRLSSLASGGRWYTDVGLLPTVIDGANYDGEDFGTSLNFTSFIGVGRQFGPSDAYQLRLRYQHISNGGISNENPGVNMLGIDFTFRLH